MTGKEAKQCSGAVPYIQFISADTIEYVGDLAQYMTEEELINAADDKLTEQMIASIIYRVLEENKNSTLTKSPNN